MRRPTRGRTKLYLRANELARSYDGLVRARDLYQRSVNLDPRFAPAWAHLGRCHRVIGKFIEASADSEARAEAAFRRALDLSPRLTVAHKFYANLEADMGRADQALVRLLGEATRHGNDPELFAGLVHACRYCGLDQESIAADAEARRLDPNVSTGVEQTLLLLGEFDRLLVTAPQPTGAGADEDLRVIALGLAGRRDEARALLRQVATRPHIPVFAGWAEYLNAWLDGRVTELADLLGGLGGGGALKVFDDPEAIFQQGTFLCDTGGHERGLALLERSVARGFFAASALAQRSQFDAIRHTPAFQSLLADAAAGRQRALAAFKDAGGERLLGR